MPVKHLIPPLVAAVSVSAFALPAAADWQPDRLSLLLGSHHAGATIDFENFNPGIFLSWDGSEVLGGQVNYTAGVFHNSYGRASISGTLGLDWPVTDDLDIGLFGGLAYYPEDGRTFAISYGDVVLIGGLQARFGNVFAQIIPSDGEFADAILTFGVTFQLR